MIYVARFKQDYSYPIIIGFYTTTLLADLAGAQYVRDTKRRWGPENTTPISYDVTPGWWLMYLFVYGTLKKGFRNHYLLEDCPFIGEAELDFCQMYSVGGFPCIINNSNTVVRGEVYEVPLGRWPALDRLEGVPHMYSRKDARVHPVGDRASYTDAQVYLWNQSTEGLPLIEDGVWK